MRLAKLFQSPLAIGLRYLVSLALLAWLARQVDWNGLRGLGGVHWKFALPALLFAALAYPLQAWRWQLLLQAQGITPPTRWIHGAFWIGQFFNSFLPGGVAGDAVRFAYLWRIAPEQKAAGAASLIADRLLGLGALCALAVFAFGLHLTMNDGGELRTLFFASLATLAFLLAACWSLARTRWWEPLSAQILGPERASALHHAALSLGRRKGTLVAATVLSVAVWLVDFASLWLFARGVGLSVGPLAITVAAAAAYFVAAMPISVGGHGVREGTLLAVLALLGVGIGQPESTALLALTFWVVSVGASLFGGVLYLSTLLFGWPLARPTSPPADFERAPTDAPR